MPDNLVLYDETTKKPKCHTTLCDMAWMLPKLGMKSRRLFSRHRLPDETEVVSTPITHTSVLVDAATLDGIGRRPTDNSVQILLSQSHSSRTVAASGTASSDETMRADSKIRVSGADGGWTHDFRHANRDDEFEGNNTELAAQYTSLWVPLNSDNSILLEHIVDKHHMPTGSSYSDIVMQGWVIGFARYDDGSDFYLGCPPA